MSTREPWGPVLIRAVQEQTRKNLFDIALAVEHDYRDLPEPRDTGLLLHSFGFNIPDSQTIHVEETLPTTFDYGEALNKGIVGNADGGASNVPTAAKVMSWVDKALGTRYYSRKVPVTTKHLHWWDIWRDEKVPGVVRKAWMEKST